MEGLPFPKRAKSWPPQGFCTRLCLCFCLPSCLCSMSNDSSPFRPKTQGPLTAFYCVDRPPCPWVGRGSPGPTHLALLLPHDVFVLILPVGILQLLLLLGISCCLGLSPPCPGRCRFSVLALELLGHPSERCEWRAGTSDSGASTLGSPRLTPVQLRPPWGLSSSVYKTRALDLL